MIKNPLINAVLAEAYIIIVASGIHYAPKQLGSQPDTVLAPIAMLSLLTFSVAMMGYFFAWQPLQLYWDGEKKRAVNFFLQTLGYFAGTTIIVVLILSQLI